MRKASIVIVVSILVLTFTVPVMAEKMKDNPKCEQWHSLIGEWTSESEFRRGPTAAWEKSTGRYQIQWILEGSFLQVQGQASGGPSFVKIVGYDARLVTHVGSTFQSSGYRSIASSGGWSGTIWKDNWTAFLPDGKVVPGRCNYEYNLDFTSFMGECQVFTDGEWWTLSKTKDTKRE